MVPRPSVSWSGVWCRRRQCGGGGHRRWRWGPDRLSVRVVSGVVGGSVLVVDAGGGAQTVCQLGWCLV